MNFADFWKAYPHPRNRGSKADAEKLFNRLNIDQRTRMEAGLPRYTAHVNETEWYQAMQARRWLNPKSENWDAWAEAQPGEDADLEQLKRECEEAAANAQRRRDIVKERWRDKWEKQYGYRPS